MIYHLDRTGTPEGLFAACDKCIDEGAKALLILACDQNRFTPELVDDGLLNISLPLFGGIFPGLIYGEENLDKGSLVVGLSQSPDLIKIPNLSDLNLDFDDQLEELTEGKHGAKTIFVWVDGFSKRIGALLDGLFNIYGLEANYLGGGAGSLSMEQKPCLFSNEGLLVDQAIIALTDIESGIGVKHGWRKIEGPFKVTECDRNLIHSLDWRPAIDVYREVVESRISDKIGKDNFFDISKSFPFGISKLGAEKLIRDPIALNHNDAIFCVGEVPKNSLIHIMGGEPDNLIQAANEALEQALNDFTGSRDETTTIFIDCISRSLFLGERYPQEIAAINRDGIKPLGALTLGEIANCGRDYLEFYNKTAVVGVLAQ